tara:strand:- start:21 stop:506 length:486 start_codon:yes stop_codon:yes gene_type:complete
MKTKAEQLEELKATAVELQQQIEDLESSKCKWFKPEIGDMYWYILGFGGTVKERPNFRSCDKSRYENFNCYETEDLATKADVMMKRNNAIIMACLTVDPDFVPDYLSGNQEHHSFWYEAGSIGHEGGWRLSKSYTLDVGPCVSTQEKWEEAAALLTEWGIE